VTAALEINEAKVWATGHGAEWWNLYRGRFEQTGRIKVITTSLGGDLVHLQCDDGDHADWILTLAVSKGVPQSALKVKETK
jgi:hypothetical protein